LLAGVPDFYDRLKSSYDERLFAQEAQGDYLNINAGSVYSAFDRQRNVQEIRLHRHLPLFWTLDFNVDPMCSLIAQRHGDDLRVLDEIVLHRASTLNACEEFQARFPNHQAGLAVYGDATGCRLQTAGTTDYKIISEFLRREGYERAQLKVPASNPAVRERVQLVNSRLLSASGESHLAISPRCKELIADFEEVTYMPDSTIIDKDRDPKRTHLSDALGYLAWQEFSDKLTIGGRNKRLFW
jgi:hypothetical protein